MGLIAAIGAGLAGLAAKVVPVITGIAAKLGPVIGKIATKVGTIMAKIDWSKVGKIVEGVVNVVRALRNLLGVKNEDEPEVLAMKAEKAEKKCEDFESTEDYIKYLNSQKRPSAEEIEEVKKDPVKHLSYSVAGMTIEGKACGEKLGIDLAPEFYVTLGKIQALSGVALSAEQLAAVLKGLKETGITTLEASEYLEGKSGENTEEIADKLEEVVNSVEGMDAEECIGEWKRGVRNV